MRITATLATLGFLAACSSQSADPAPADGTDVQSPSEAAKAPSDDGLTADEKAYKKKVSDRVHNSVVNSLMKEHGISETQAECLTELGVSTMMSPKSDLNARTRVETCNVDPDEVLRDG